MKTNAQKKKGGFTLVELIIASAIGVVVIGMGFGALIQGLLIWQQYSIVNELTMHLETAMERIRIDLRLSSVGTGLMSFYPANAPVYTAISFPLSVDSDGDGMIDRDADGKILWNRTVVYHVRPGAPDQLIRTVFQPRNPDATPEDIYNQLEAVVYSANAADINAAAMPGESAQSQVVFANLVDLRFSPPFNRFDGYAPFQEKARTFTWGSVVLESGFHELAFTVIGKNPDSGGYEVHIDHFTMSHSASDREGEIFWPVNENPISPFFSCSPSGGVVHCEEAGVGWKWHGNAQLVFTGTGEQSRISFSVFNDLWCDTNFDNPGGVLSSNCSVKFDRSFEAIDPFIPKVVVSMDKGIAWEAFSEPAANFGSMLLPVGNAVLVNNIIYGVTNHPLDAILREGKWARFEFRAAEDVGLVISNAVVSAPMVGFSTNVTFDGGESWVFVHPGSNTWSDWVPDIVFGPGQNYEVSALMGGFGDDDLDLYVGDRNGRIWFYENVGTKYNPAWAAPDFLRDKNNNAFNFGSMSTPTFADLTGNSFMDLVAGSDNGRIFIARRNASPFAPEFEPAEELLHLGSAPHNRRRVAPTFVDINGNGLLDMIVGGDNGYLTLVENAGSKTNFVVGAISHNWKGINTGNTSSPVFGDLNGNGLLDLVVGGEHHDGSWNGFFYTYINTGTAADFQYSAVITNAVVLPPGGDGAVWPRIRPALVDINGNGKLDLFLGHLAGTVYYYENIGTVNNFEWDAPVIDFANVDLGNSARTAPAFANHNPSMGGVHYADVSDLVFSDHPASTNGVNVTRWLALSRVEVGYPEQAIYRSGVFDTGMAAPNYRELNWTELTVPDQGDIRIRVRSGSDRQMSDGDWQEAEWANDGYFLNNTGNSLSMLPKRRYLQYEALFRCGFNDSSAHTNNASAFLRNVTIDWDGPTGLVDLRVNFGRGPNCGIVSATVNGQEFIKGVEAEMTIFKEGRTGWSEVSGRMEVRPLNTGR